jgi:predicted ATP-dependent endonuclease of OLD family
MFIQSIKIENYRSFTNFSAKLNKLSVVIGENDAGKSNFFSALALPLSSNQIDYYQKRLNISDFNIDIIKVFFNSIISNESTEIQKTKIPKIFITIDFSAPEDDYEKQIIGKWIHDDAGEESYRIRYEFKPKNDDDLLAVVKDLLDGCTKVAEVKWFTLPIELYEYRIVSVNNNKEISFNELKHVRINTINAERDDFADGNTVRSNNLLTKLLINTLSDHDKNDINKAYTDFFSSIENTDSFDKIIKSITKDDDFENIRDFVNEIECIPNLPNLKSVLSNITLQYGDEFLYQKGLGERNLVYILILFAYYKTNENKSFNLCCIEEPEAHLSVNNLKLTTDFIVKSVKNSSALLQTIISTHNPSVINKLNLSNVLAFSGDTAINLSNVDNKLLDYLRKRPNFDILKLIFANKVILVEGQSEEMLLNSFLLKRNNSLNNIEVISIGQKGYRTFLDIWLELNKNNPKKLIGVVRDFDDQQNAKDEHDKYDIDNENIFVRTTNGYTLENDLADAGDNAHKLSALFNVENNVQSVADHMISGKTEGMLKLCDAMLDEKSPLNITLPDHINEIIVALS